MDSDQLSFHGVSYAYPGGGRLAERFPALRRHALHDVTFSVKPGTSLAVLGHNGSGKSTLLQLCNGLLAPSCGNIAWNGKPLDRSRAGLARLRSEVGLLFQDPDDQLFAGTLRQDVAIGPSNQGLDARQVRWLVDEALDLVDLREFADLPPHVFSHGMRKRAALAGVLATRPRMLLLDEPTAGLDRRGEERLLEILGERVARGVSVVFSTHDLDLARRWAHQTLLLDEGRLVAVGDTHAVLSDDQALLVCGLRRDRSRPRAPRGSAGTEPGDDLAHPSPAVGRGIVVAATGSGCGKTSIACGILRALSRRGLAVRAAKCGPDYLDPLWLGRAAGSECPNLDPWMASAEGVRRLAAGEGLLVVESAMGLYDGIRPDSDEGSGAEVASLLDLPVLLIVDASGAARTVAAVVQGMRDFGPARIAGVVANRVGSARHAHLVGQALESRLLPPLVGFVVDGALPSLPERHLGLVPPDNGDDVFERMADAVASTIELDRLVGLMRPIAPPGAHALRPRDGVSLRLGLASDDAFRFAYAPVVQHLRSRGVEVVPFSPVSDHDLPAGLDGLWLCGGYPESHAAALAENSSMRAAIARFCASGRVVLAECGGLLYLTEELVDLQGAVYPMCGVIPARGVLGTRLQALGYRTARAREDSFLLARGQELRGHEFHYGVLEGEPGGAWRAAYDWEGTRGALGPEGWWNGSVLATWFHGWLDGEATIGRWIESMRAAGAKEETWT